MGEKAWPRPANLQTSLVVERGSRQPRPLVGRMAGSESCIEQPARGSILVGRMKCYLTPSTLRLAVMLEAVSGQGIKIVQMTDGSYQPVW